MAERGCRVHVVPSTITFDELQSLNPDGVFFSNGPGDPEQADPEVNLLRQVLDAGYPFFGICFGNQLLAARSASARTSSNSATAASTSRSRI